MSKFEQNLRMWLMSYGILDAADTICENPRIAASIASKDNGGIVIDLIRVLPHGSEAANAMNDPMEKFMLLQLLK